MKKVYPEVHLTGIFVPMMANILDACEDICQKRDNVFNSNTHISDRHESETPIEYAARMCYLSFAPNVNKNVTKIRENAKEYFYNILKSGHGSVLEHCSVQLSLKNVSRVFTHELVRHRAGTAFSQTSMRYVRIEEIPFVLPPFLHPKRTEIIEEITNSVNAIEKSIAKLNKLADMDTLSFEEKKFFTSLIRRIAPEGIATNIVMTTNLRALRHMIELRTSPAAEVEIRYVFHEIYRLCEKHFPNVFQDFAIVFDKYPDTRIASSESLPVFSDRAYLLDEYQNHKYSCVPEFSKV